MFPLCVEASSIPNQDFRFSTIDVIELEKIGAQSSIIQDNQGFMWFGGSNGLARFDGYDVKIYRNNPKNKSSLSYNEVNEIEKDSRGQLWVGTSQGLNLYDTNTGGFIHYAPGSQDSQLRLPSGMITALAKDSLDGIWVGTMDQGISKIDVTSGHVKPVQLHSLNLDVDKIISIRALLVDSTGLLWMAVDKLGLCVFNPVTGAVDYPNDKSELTRKININKITEDPDGNIWLGTSNSGLLQLNPANGDVKHYKNESSDPKSLYHNTVWDIYFDNNGMLWIATDDSLELYQPKSDNFKHFTRLTGTHQYGKVRSLYQSQSELFWLGMFPSGTAYLNQDVTVFRNFQSNSKDNNSLSHSAVTAVVEDKSGNFWIGTEGGLDYFNTKEQTITHFIHEEGNPLSLPSNSVLSLLIDKTDTLWVGTWKGGWASFHEQTQTFVRPTMTDGSSAHSEEEVWSMYEDKSGDLWIAGLYLYDREHNQFQHYQQAYPDGDQLSSPRVKVMHEDNQGNFWIGTISGLDLFDRKTGKIHSFKSNQVPQNGLSDHFIYSILEDTEDNLWFGTLSGGINKWNKETQTFTSIRAKDGLFDDSITGMIDDLNGNLWFISGSGLIRYQKELKSFELYDRKNGLTGDLFHRNAIILSSRGEIVFGGANGLTILDPKQLKANTAVPPIVLTELEVLNSVVSATDPKSILKQPLNFTQNFTLKHQHNVFSINYSALNFRMPQQNKYAYMLQGFDKDWHFVDNSRRATYTNLDPGNYTFKVKGSNNSGVWNTEGTSVQIKILPEWWETLTAYIIYFIFSITLLSIIFFVLLRLKEAKNERIINTQLRQVDQMKDTFLANTSHELRTPLNGIIGLTESIISSPEDISSEDTLNKLHIVVNSGKRLSNIINDILDFSKLKCHEIELHQTPVNIFTLVHSTLQLSESLIDKKDIRLLNYIDPHFPKFLADEQRLSQILFNLVGNAIKFTQKGHVSIDAVVINDQIQIKVSDSGIGISTEDLDRIFLPFEQALITGTRGKTIGTGLGLAVTKNLIELHGGSIEVESDQNYGSIFIVTLPFNQESPLTALPINKAKEYINIDSKILNKQAPSQKITPETTNRKDSCHILIVDDEPINRMVLQGYLARTNHTTTECASGFEALEKLNKHACYDMILLDVMMPGMSGYEVCREIRKSYNLLELPVIFLTAKSQVEDLAEGYDAGANDFMHKPVIKEELLGKIHMHLQASKEYQKLLQPQI